MNSPADHVVATRAAELGLRFQSVNSGDFCIAFPEASDPSPSLCGLWTISTGCVSLVLRSGLTGPGLDVIYCMANDPLKPSSLPERGQPSRVASLRIWQSTAN